ncbi:MAG: hypothetical protein DMF84_09775 [Acidobacteria bacterium]|nr:MAG: hypothetical protein DMF84_09775 [Acidobacteriota bacterium]
MKRFVYIAAVAALTGVGACGKSTEEQRKEEAAKQAEQTAKTAEQASQQAAKGLEQMAKGLEAMASGGDQKPVAPVSFHDMQALFPELDGWTKEKPTGERMTSPFAYSQAQVRYTKGESNIELKIVDSGFNQLLLTPYAMFLQAGYEKETESGYEKSVQVANQPGWEKWNSEGKDGELNALVGKRFLVTIEGNQIADTKVLHDIAGKIDMNKLAALK